MSSVKRILDDKGSDVETSSAETPVNQIATVLADKRIGAVVILDGSKIAGILSERDIVRAVARDGGAALQKSAGTYMTSKVVTCTTSETINDVMQKMTAGRFRHLPVVEDDRLLGIVSIGDVVKRRIAEVEREASEMRNYIAMA
jgi:CBS domain-containing protein